jgi:hypothetical protein
MRAMVPPARAAASMTAIASSITPQAARVEPAAEDGVAFVEVGRPDRR